MANEVIVETCEGLEFSDVEENTNQKHEKQKKGGNSRLIYKVNKSFLYL